MFNPFYFVMSFSGFLSSTKLATLVHQVLIGPTQLCASRDEPLRRCLPWLRSYEAVSLDITELVELFSQRSICEKHCLLQNSSSLSHDVYRCVFGGTSFNPIVWSEVVVVRHHNGHVCSSIPRYPDVVSFVLDDLRARSRS